MIPILFAENATSYTTNGIGRLSDAISCVVTEERNGQYELAMQYPVTGQHYSDIGIRKIIVAKPFEGGTLQAFRIYDITKLINGRIEINAHHLSYDLSKNVAMPFSVSLAPTACASALAGLKSHAVEDCPFTFWTNVTTASSYSQLVPDSIRRRLGGVEGSVLDQFGGEYEWDNFTVKLHNQRGRVNTGITLRYGKNITDIEQEENIAETVTGLVPYWTDSDGNLVTLTEKAVYSQYASRYSAKLTEVIDLSGDFEAQPTETQLRAAAEALVNKSTFGLPKVSIEVSFVALWQTEEYKDIAPLQSVQLCDEITVHFEKLGIDATAKVVGTEYDVLAERYLKIQIGSARSSLSQVIDDNNARTIQAIEDQKVETSTAINNATKWLTTAGGYVIAIKNQDGSWKELAFSNMTDPYNANAKVLRINNNGLGFSTTGLNGTFRNAWTIDGNLIADFIHGGTLTLGGNGNGNGWLKIVDGSNPPVEIGRWDVNGIKVYKGSLNGASLTLGGASNGSGTITVKGTKTVDGQTVEYTVCTINRTGIHIFNDSGTEIGTWNASGINIDSGDINLGNGVFHVTNAGALTASNITVTGGSILIKDGNTENFKVSSDGTLKSIKGTIGGFTIEANYLRSGATNSSSDGAVTLANADFTRTINSVSRTTLRMAIGGKFGVNKDGTLYAKDAILTGEITASSGTIGGFTVESHFLRSDTTSSTANGAVTLANTNFTREVAGTEISTLRFAIGARFGVTQLGALYASGVHIAGEITATGGTIGGFTISSTAIAAGELSGTSNGDVALTTADFSRSIGGSSRANLRFAIGGSFGVRRDGAVWAANLALLGGSISIKDSNDIETFKVTSEGKLTARDGYIGNGSSGWVIGDSNIHNGCTGMSNTTQGTYIGTRGIRSQGSSSDDYVKIADGNIDVHGDITTRAGKFKQIGNGYLSLREAEDGNDCYRFDLGQHYCNCLYEDNGWHWVNGGATAVWRYLTGAYSPSDARYKKDVEPIDIEFSKSLILKTQTYSFRYTYDDSTLNFGSLAQELKETLDELGCEEKNGLVYVPEDETDDKWSIEYKQFVPHLINTIKDLYSEIDSLKAELKALKETA